MVAGAGGTEVVCRLIGVNLAPHKGRDVSKCGHFEAGTSGEWRNLESARP
jgi:hypothetical protein